MCLTVKKGTRKYTTKKDIPVFKVLVFESRRSVYHDLEYPKGELVTSVTPLAIHYMWGEERYRKVGRGLHAYTTKNRAFHTKNIGRNKSREVFNAIIPKGSVYYLGDDNDIVSNQLIVNDQI